MNTQELTDEFKVVNYDVFPSNINIIDIRSKEYYWIIMVKTALTFLPPEVVEDLNKKIEEIREAWRIKTRSTANSRVEHARIEIMRAQRETCLAYLKEKHSRLSVFHQIPRFFELTRINFDAQSVAKQRFIKMIIDDADEVFQKYKLLKHLCSESSPAHPLLVLNGDVMGKITVILANLSLSRSYTPENPSKRRKLT